MPESGFGAQTDAKVNLFKLALLPTLSTELYMCCAALYSCILQVPRSRKGILRKKRVQDIARTNLGRGFVGVNLAFNLRNQFLCERLQAHETTQSKCQH